MAATMKTTRRPPKKMSKKRKLEDMSVGEFFMNSDTEDTSSEASFSQQPPASKMKKAKKTMSVEVVDIKQKDTKGKKKNPLKNLQDKDPEFYKFLLDEDKELLEDEEGDIEESDDEDSDDDDFGEDLDSDDDDDEEEEEGERRFQPPSKLEVASDDEDDDDVDDDEEGDSGSDGEMRKTLKSKKKLITGAMIKSWRRQAQESPSVEVLQQWIAALAAAAQHAGMSVETSTHFRVANNAAFNAVMRLCLTDTAPLLERLLSLRSLSEQLQVFSKKNKKWKSVRGTVKTYCVMMLQLSGEFSEWSMVNVVLRHMHKLVVCYAAFPKLTKVFLKRLVKLWSTGEETTRVLAFLCLNRLVRLQPDTLLDPTLKQMYMAYVNNCKFVSPTLLPLTVFMQRTLVEAFLIQESLAYQHAFVYIRQLAIHLRNAITVKKKEACQLVYNWQYILSLGLWTQLLSTAHPSPVLQPLVYPLVQVIIGTIRLLPTAQYYPLRFHCVRYLTDLCDAAYIPVLPFLLEVLDQTDFNKKLKGGGMKKTNMTTILKFSKPQLQEKAFKESVIEQLCELLFDYLNTQSHTAAFPELIVPLVIQLKDFTKKCKVAVLCRQVKQVTEKAEESAKFMEARRRTTTFNLADGKAVELWESKNKEEGTPLSKFYVSWRKMQDRRKQKEMAAKDQMTTSGERLVPEMKRPTPTKPPATSAEDREQFTKLFGSDEEEEDDTFRFLPKEERKKRERDDLESDGEDYSDFDSDDMEQLAKSASEDEESDDDDSEEDEEEEEETKPKAKSQKPSKPKGKKQKKPTSQKKPPSVKPRQKLHIENDGGDIVQDFTMSDSD